MKRRVPRVDKRDLEFAKGEFIGLVASVVESTDAGLVGLAGEIVDETLHTLTFRTAEGRRVQVPKAGNVFEFVRPKGDVVRLEGRALEFRPEDRGKKVR